MTDSQSPMPKSKSSAITAGEPRQFEFFEAMKIVFKMGSKARKLDWAGEDKNDYVLVKDGFLSICRKGEFYTFIVSSADMAGKDWIILDSTE